MILGCCFIFTTNESKACILMASRRSHNATVGLASNKNTKRSTSIATGCLKNVSSLILAWANLLEKWEEQNSLCHLRTFTSDIEFGHFWYPKFYPKFKFCSLRNTYRRNCFPVLIWNVLESILLTCRGLLSWVSFKLTVIHDFHYRCLKCTLFKKWLLVTWN